MPPVDHFDLEETKGTIEDIISLYGNEEEFLSLSGRPDERNER